MLYPLSYWSFLIAAPPSRGAADSKIIAAATICLKRQEAKATAAHLRLKPALPQQLG